MASFFPPPLQCEKCNLHFRHKSQLRLHLRQKHGAITNTKVQYRLSSVDATPELSKAYAPSGKGRARGCAKDASITLGEKQNKRQKNQTPLSFLLFVLSLSLHTSECLEKARSERTRRGLRETGTRFTFGLHWFGFVPTHPTSPSCVNFHRQTTCACVCVCVCVCVYKQKRGVSDLPYNVRAGECQKILCSPRPPPCAGGKIKECTSFLREQSLPSWGLQVPQFLSQNSPMLAGELWELKKGREEGGKKKERRGKVGGRKGRKEEKRGRKEGKEGRKEEKKGGLESPALETKEQINSSADSPGLTIIRLESFQSYNGPEKKMDCPHCRVSCFGGDPDLSGTDVQVTTLTVSQGQAIFSAGESRIRLMTWSNRVGFIEQASCLAAKILRPILVEEGREEGERDGKDRREGRKKRREGRKEGAGRERKNHRITKLEGSWRSSSPASSSQAGDPIPFQTKGCPISS
ncbi:B-cell lymphoma 6 protein, partial [Ophiophagus hannah]